MALERATAAIAADDAVEVEPVVDRDTQGVAGSPDISATIFKKIEEADVFVADVSIIGRLNNDRPMPNPNVLVELGFAIKALDYGRVILVYNTAYGALTDLPFDLRARRVMIYNMIGNAEEKAEERKKLSASLKEAIKAALLVNKETPVVESPLESLLKAIENKQPNRIIKLRKELRDFLLQIDAKAPLKFIENGTVDLLMKGINSIMTQIESFAQICYMTAVMNDEEAALEIHQWFGNIIERYEVPNNFFGRYKEEDFDYYKFLGQELYVVLIASLLKEEKWIIIKKLLNEPIHVKYLRMNGGPMDVKFNYISRFVRSLHDESEKIGKISLQANILNDHFKSEVLKEILSFDDFMAADLLLFMVVKMNEEEGKINFHSWRSVSFLFMRTSPSFLIKAKRSNYAIVLSDLCGVENVEMFKEKLRKRMPEINNFFSNNLHSWPVQSKDINEIGTV